MTSDRPTCTQRYSQTWYSPFLIITANSSMFCARIAAESKLYATSHQEPGRVYEYQISGEAARSFRAAAEPGPDAGFVFVVYGDMGESEHKDAKAPG